MTRIATTLFAASALALSSSAVFACGFQKTDGMASYDGAMTPIETADAMTVTPATTDAATTTEALATSDVEPTATPTE